MCLLQEEAKGNAKSDALTEEVRLTTTCLYDYSICSGVHNTDTPNGRSYATPDGVFPSITTVLDRSIAKPQLDAWKERVGAEEAARISREATERGSLVHLYMEQVYAGATNDVRFATLDALREQFGSTGVDMAQNLLDATAKGCLPSDMWTQETPLWSKKKRVAGRVDMIGLWHGKPAAIDFKTSRKPKREEWLNDYYQQAAFYALAHNELFGSDITRLVILITCETGEVQTFLGDARAWEGHLNLRIKRYYESHHLAA